MYKNRLTAVFLILLTTAVLFARRPDQFLAPYLWVEDGKETLRAYLEHGIGLLLLPTSGYMITATKIISYTAFRVSVPWAPEIQVALTTLFTCAVIVAVALSPSHLKAPVFCAIAAVLVPLNPEPFALAAYAFWWAGLLFVLALLWGERKQSLRWFFILLGGLSTPLAVSLFPLFALRAAIERTRAEYIALALAGITACVQAVQIFQPGGTLYQITPATFKIAIDGFVGGFLRVHEYAAVAVVAILILAWTARRQLDRYFLLLVAAYTVTCGTVALRLPMEWIYMGTQDPANTAPRYSFYPFIFLAWILIWIAAVSHPWIRTAVAAVLIAVHVPALPYMQRREDVIDWRTELAACAASPAYELPIQYNGALGEVWHAKFKGSECREFIDWSWL